MVEQVTGERLTAGPCKCPKRRRYSIAREDFLGRLPHRGDLRRELKTDFGHQGRRRDHGIATDEERAIQADQLRWPAMMPAKMSQPTTRLSGTCADNQRDLQSPLLQ